MGSAAADPYYAKARVGTASSDFSLEEPYNGDVNDEAAMYGIDFGYRISDLLAVEVGASWYGDFSGQGSPCRKGQICILLLRTINGNEINVYHASLVPGIDRGRLRLFAEAGLYRAEIDTNTVFPNDEFTRNGWLLGAGARWRFNERWSVSLQASALEDNMEQIGVAVGWHP